MKKTVIISAILIAFATAVSAQYSYAIGIRSGGTSGLTFKKINSSHTASELIVGFWNDGLSLTGLYQKHPSVAGIEGMHWLFGAGAHVTFYEANFRGYRGPAWFDIGDNNVADGDLGIGLDAIAGIEYKFPVIPLAVSLEIKPFVEFTTDGEIWFSPDPGLGIKLAF